MCRRGLNIYKRKDGRYEGRCAIGRENGRTKYSYVYGYRYAAVRTEVMRRKLQYEQTGPCPSSLAFGDWAVRWMTEEASTNIKKSSCQTYWNLLNGHLLPRFEKVALPEIRQNDVQDFIEAMRSGGLAESSIRACVRLLGACLKSAQAEGLIERNPCDRLRLRWEKIEEQRVFSLLEQQKIRNCTDPDVLPALLGLYAGLRVGEISGLRFEDIDLVHLLIHIRRTVLRIQKPNAKGTELVVSDPKTASSDRVVPLAPFLAERLLQMVEAREPGHYIFGHEDVPVEPRTLQRRFKRLMKKLEIENVHFHTLRHTFATRLIELGTDVGTVSKLMGHSSVRTTLDIYTHSAMESKTRAIEHLSEI